MVAQAAKYATRLEEGGFEYGWLFPPEQHGNEYRRRKEGVAETIEQAFEQWETMKEPE